MTMLLLPPKLGSYFSAQRPHPPNSLVPSSTDISLRPCISISKLHAFYLFLPYPNNKHDQNRLLWRRRGRKTAFVEEEEEDGDEKSINSKFEEAVNLFNKREYYECHDLLESIWYSSNDPIRTLIHAILQSAVAFHHLSNQNHKGAMMELGEGLCKLRKLDFKGGPFHQFEQEISAVLEFVYQTQLELAACDENNQQGYISRDGKNLTNEQRQAILETLMLMSVNNKLKRDATKIVAVRFNVSMRTVQRIWHQAKTNFGNGVAIYVSSRKPKNSGRKKVDVDYERFRELPFRRRRSFRSIASALNLSVGTIQKWFKLGAIRRHTNAIKPFLNEGNMRARLSFCINMIDQNSIPHNPTFYGMYNIVHIDEKWFNLTKQTEKYYLLPDEEEPLRTCKSKNFITKVMFLAAVARPRFDQDGNVDFTGKIGIFPFTTREPAIRKSKNRSAGPLVTKPITSVNKDVCRDFLLNKVLPSIREKWPRSEIGRPIFIQQDNAKPYVGINDEQFLAYGRMEGFDIQLMSQPPKSPDLNVLDLGFFNAIQALQHQEAPRSIDELVEAVQKAFEEYPINRLNRIFLSLQSGMIEIMKARGSNNYPPPHMGKDTLEASGCLPTQLSVDPELYASVCSYLQEQG